MTTASNKLVVDAEFATNAYMPNSFFDDEKDDVEEQSDGALTTPTNDRPPLDTPLSEVSKQFDRNNKGYLDATEQQLRRMDTQNLGYLTVNKVYGIMDTLQKEQKNSATLLHALEKQQRQMINMKKGIIALCSFAVLLALSNIGTSFAAAKLAREMKVSSGTGDLTDLSTGERVAVTVKLPNMEMSPIDPERRRQLSRDFGLCQKAFGAGDSAFGGTDNVAECSIAGSLSQKDMVKFHKQFCNGWPEEGGCKKGGVEKARLTCNGRVSIIDSSYLDDVTPYVDPNYYNWTVYPDTGRAYHGIHYVWPPNVDAWHGPPCLQEFVVGMYCDTENDEVPCIVLVAMPAGTKPCYSEYVELCGHPDDYKEGKQRI